MSDTTMSFQDMLDQARAAGATTDAPPPGQYMAVVVSAAAKRSKKDKVEIGFKLRVTEGAHKDAGIWGNQYLSPESPVALDIWFRTFDALGLPMEWWTQFGANMDQAAAAAAEHIKGVACQITVANEEYPKGSGSFSAKVKRVSKLVPGQGAAPASSVPAAPAAPAAAPAPGASAAPPKSPF